MAGATWSDQETRALLNLWGNDRVQRQLEGAVRNKAVFQKIHQDMTAQGYAGRSWEQCRVRLKNLTAQYRRIRDENSRSGRGRVDFPYFDLLDRILGTRPASRPTNILSSGQSSSSIVAPVMTNSATTTTTSSLPVSLPTTSTNSTTTSSLPVPLPTTSANSTTTTTSSLPVPLPTTSANSTTTTISSLPVPLPTTSTNSTTTTTSTSSLPVPLPTTSTSTTRTATADSLPGSSTSLLEDADLDGSVNDGGTAGSESTPTIRRKRTVADRRISLLTEDLERQTKESDCRFFEFEERKMKTEAENDDKRRKEDREHMMNMQQMFLQNMQQMLLLASGHGTILFSPATHATTENPTSPSNSTNPNSQDDSGL